MTQALSTDVATHKLKIKWMETKYITRKLAENIFAQILDESKSSITILNPENLTFISKYKNDVELIPLEWEERTIEDKLVWLSDSKKEKIRLTIIDRKKNNLPITDWIINNIIEKFN